MCHIYIYIYIGNGLALVVLYFSVRGLACYSVSSLFSHTRTHTLSSLSACEQNDIIFVGPSASVIRTMGDKTLAKAAAINCGVPVVPGSDGPAKSAEDVKVC